GTGAHAHVPDPCHSSGFCRCLRHLHLPLSNFRFPEGPLERRADRRFRLSACTVTRAPGLQRGGAAGALTHRGGRCRGGVGSGELSCLGGVEAAFVAVDRRSVAVGRAFRFESGSGGPAHVMPGEGLEPVDIVVAAHMPEPPRDDRLGEKGARAHAGTGSWAGSSAGAGAGTGSSSGAISISCSVSGAPMSIVCL